MQFRLNNQLIRDYLAALGWVSTPGELELLGLRGARVAAGSLLETVPNDPNRYNDLLVLYGPELEFYPASVDPGLHFQNNPVHVEGCAHLLNGQWLYKPGQHRGHPALVQAGPVKVWRDGDRDGKRDPYERTEEGYFGINIHAGGTSPRVDRHSAGCQVIEGGWEGEAWQDFLRRCIRSGQDRFRYTLIDAAGLARSSGGKR